MTVIYKINPTVISGFKKLGKAINNLKKLGIEIEIKEPKISNPEIFIESKTIQE